MNANDREVISGLTKQIELLQEQIKSMNEVMAKMVEKDNPKVETEEDRNLLRKLEVILKNLIKN